MPDPADWSVATWEGSRRRQHQEFLALPFAEKLAVIEELAEVARFFAERREARGLPLSYSGAAVDGPARVPERRSSESGPPTA
jgi:hypothetical protein